MFAGTNKPNIHVYSYLKTKLAHRPVGRDTGSRSRPGWPVRMPSPEPATGPCAPMIGLTDVPPWHGHARRVVLAWDYLLHVVISCVCLFAAERMRNRREKNAKDLHVNRMKKTRMGDGISRFFQQHPLDQISILRQFPSPAFALQKSPRH